MTKKNKNMRGKMKQGWRGFSVVKFVIMIVYIIYKFFNTIISVCSLVLKKVVFLQCVEKQYRVYLTVSLYS